MIIFYNKLCRQIELCVELKKKKKFNTIQIDFIECACVWIIYYMLYDVEKIDSCVAKCTV